MQHFGKVAVLMGGFSSEREISLISGKAILEALQSRGVDAHAFDPAETELSELKTQNFDMAFNILHGTYGEDGTVQGALEALGIPYTGCGVLASALGMDKYRCKLIWSALGLPVPPFESNQPQKAAVSAWSKSNRPENWRNNMPNYAIWGCTA